mgnify:CR=1 FL=1
MAFPQDAPNPQGKEVTETPFLLFCDTGRLFIVAHRETYRVRYVLFHGHKVTAFGNTFDKTGVFFLFIVPYASATGANGAACWCGCYAVGACIADTSPLGGGLVSERKGVESGIDRPKMDVYYMHQARITETTNNVAHARSAMPCVSDLFVYAKGPFAVSGVY